MPAPKIHDDELVTRLTRIFQEHGYEGASLSRISKATGLEKASLYHRFPGGKQDMANTVLRTVSESFGEYVFAPLRGGGSLSTRLKETARRLSEFYADGERSCLLDSMSFPESGDEVRQSVKHTYEILRDLFASVARESGYAPAAAVKRAQDAILLIEGALVIARVTGDPKPFRDVVGRLGELLLKAT